MDLYTIQNELIAGRDARAWYKIAIAGPDFHYRVSYGHGPDGRFSDIVSEHHSRATCREEPMLTVSWGMDVHADDMGLGLHFPWSSEFVDESVRLFWVDFFWAGALIDRVELASVDGSHGGVIPIPDHNMHVSAYEIAVAVLIDDMDTGRTDDRVLRTLARIEATASRDEGRAGAGSSWARALTRPQL